MEMYRICHSIKGLLFLAIILFSQVSFGQKEARLYEKAEASLEIHDYHEAWSYYQQVSQIAPSYADVEYKLELASLLVPEGDTRSLDTFIGFESTYGAQDDHYFYWLGKIYTHRYMISEAVSAFEKFEQRIAYSGSSQDETKILIAHSQKLQDFFNNPDNYEIHQLESPVNSTAAEMSPVYFEGNDELLFASDRSGSGIEPFAIYYSKKTPGGWSSPKEVTNLGRFSRPNANIEVVSEDSKLFIFKEEKGGDLYYSVPVGENWTEPVEFDARVSNNHIASHFFINEHEDRIIFASAENGTGLDIHESFKDPSNGKWSKPAPFYSSVNSEFDEDSPYLSPDESRLYFSSNRPGGVGRYDVYMATYNPDDFSWSEPKNLGWPINSPDDEFHFKMNPDQTSGYFISNRLHSLGDYDIYFFWEIEKVKVEGRVFDQKANGPLTNAEIRFHPSQYLDEYFRSAIDQNGRYNTSVISDETFQVDILRDGQVIFTDRFEVHDAGKEPTTHVKDFVVK